MLEQWNSLSKEAQDRRKSVQITLEEDILVMSEEKYWRTYDVAPDEGVPEQVMLDRCGAHLESTYQAWIDRVSMTKNPKTPAWVTPLFAIGAKKMADITLRTIMMEWFGSNVWARDIDIDELPLPTAQHCAIEISKMVMDILGYQKARNANRKDWRKQSQYLKSWTKRRCNGFAAKIDKLYRSNFTRKQKEDFGHHMLRLAETSGVIKLQNVRRTVGGRIFRDRVLVSFSDNLLKDMASAHDDMIAKASLLYRPMIVPPVPHELTTSGGNLLQCVRKPMIQRYRDVYDTEEEEKKQRGSIPSKKVIDGLNALMSTEYTINKPVLDIMDNLFKANHCEGNLPLYDFEEFTFDLPYPVGGTTDERIRWRSLKHERYCTWYKDEQNRSRMLVRLRLAKDLMSYGFFYQVYTCDFRGRAYTTCELLSPQSGDYDRGLIMYATPKPQTDEGRYWLKVHIANLFDQDKITFDDRVKWFDDNIDMFKRVAEDPYDTRSFWLSDKLKKNTSFQRIASVLDYFRKDGMTQVPVYMDGTCNGIQHWAAILRDAGIGKLVNLYDSGIPQDIYGEVANKCTSLMKADIGSNIWASKFLDYWEGTIKRNIPKRAVMTDPYGVTFYGIRKYCRSEGHLSWVSKEEMSAAVMELATYIDAALKGCLTSANEGKAWLKDVADLASNNKKDLEWTTPCGFKVIHQYYELVTRRSVAKMFDMKELYFGNVKMDSINAVGVNLAIAPNFIHSLDASHMWDVISDLLEHGIDGYSFIHDSYGTYAFNIPLLRKVTGQQFYAMHKENQLSVFKDTVEKLLGIKLPPVPKEGALEIKLVVDSPYFFQ